MGLWSSPKRERLITIGIRKDLANKIEFNFPVKHQYKPVIGDVKLDENPPKDECQRYSEYKEKYLPLFLQVVTGKILILT